ncbi:uncharacterized protein ACMZJ9_022848 [Mantella aurantiaca]
MYTDSDDSPHTLRSAVHSSDISIPRPSLHSMSFKSLEISQSPTIALLQDPGKSQCSVLDTQTPCTTANISNQSSSYKPAPPEIPTNLCTTNAETIQQFSSPLHSASEKYVEEVAEDKNIDRQSCHTFSGSPNANLPELLHELSPGVTNHNSLSKPTSHLSCNHVPGPNIFSSSDIPPSASFYPSITSQQFFSFVILHAPEDLMLASRVCKDLENHCVGKGTTFCEGFETPGVSLLTCLENAVENSAYIILLLTDAFLQATWGGFQSTTAMMNSIEKANKLGSVIPFYPRLNKLKGKIPMWIKAIIPLNENSPSFEIKVRNTLKPDVIKNQHKLWEREIVGTANYLPQQQNISIHWSMGDTTAVLPQQTLPVIQGQTPVIHISNARNVQIGDQNSMNIQFAPNEPQTDSDTSICQDVENETPN